MVAEVRIYFEGDKKLRPGFHAFLKEVIDAARERRIRFQLIAGGTGAVRDSVRALEDHSSSFLVLLVDSEGPAPSDPLDAVRSRGDWRPSRAVREDEVHLMVQAMEAWFLADQDALRQYYGSGFAVNRLPGDPTRVEVIPKSDAIRGLEDAARDTQKGKYHKTEHAPDLLAKVDPVAVRAAAPYCERLFRELEAAISLQNESSN